MMTRESTPTRSNKARRASSRLKSPLTPQLPPNRPNRPKRPRDEHQYGQFRHLIMGNGEVQETYDPDSCKDHIPLHAAKALLHVHSQSHHVTKGRMTVEFEVGTPAEPRTMKYKSSNNGWVPFKSGEAKAVVPHCPVILNVKATQWSDVYNTIRDCNVEALQMQHKAMISNDIEQCKYDLKKCHNDQKLLEALQCYFGRSLNRFYELIHQKQALLKQVPLLREKAEDCKANHLERKEELAHLDCELARLSDIVEVHKVNKERFLEQLTPIIDQLNQVFSQHPEVVEFLVSTIKGESEEFAMPIPFDDRQGPENNPMASSEPPSSDLFVSPSVPSSQGDQGSVAEPEYGSEIESVFSVQSPLEKAFNILLDEVKRDKYMLEKSIEEESREVERRTGSYDGAFISLRYLEKELGGYHRISNTCHDPLPQETSSVTKTERLALAERHAHLDNCAAEDDITKLDKKKDISVAEFTKEHRDKRDLIQGDGFMKFMKHAFRDSTKKIVGPLRSYIQFSKDASEQQKHLILAYLEAHLTTFLVTTDSHRHYFENRKKQYNAFDVNVVVFEKRGLKSRDFQGDGNTSSILELLHFDDDSVKEYLISKYSIDIVGVSHLKFLPEKGHFVDPKSNRQFTGEGHIRSKTLIVTSDYRCDIASAVPSAVDFGKRSKWLNLRLLEAFEQVSDFRTGLQGRVASLKDQIAALKSECDRKKGELVIAQQKLCEARERIDKIACTIHVIPTLKDDCESLRKSLESEQTKLVRAEGDRREKYESRQRIKERFEALRTQAEAVVKNYKHEKAALTRLEEMTELTEADKLCKEYQNKLDVFKLANPEVILSKEAKKESQDSVAKKLKHNAFAIKSLQLRLENCRKQQGDYVVIGPNTIIDYVAKLGVEIDTQNFDRTVATAAISAVINQMNCPTVFVNGDIEVSSDKQLLIVGERTGDLIDLQ